MHPDIKEERMVKRRKALNFMGVKSLKKGMVFVVLALALVALPLFTSCSAPAATETIELTYSNFFPPTHLHSVLAEQFCEEINKRTDGKVEITYYPGGTLTPAPQVYGGVVEGISDMGMSVLAYSMGRFPATELVDMPHAYPNGWVATMVANDFYKEYQPEEFDDVHVLYFHAHGPGVLFTTEKPVYKLEDLKGLIIRSTGIGAKIIEALGAEGYGGSQGEAYELMSKGTVDGSLTPREVLKGWNQAEVVKYVTGCYDVGYTANMFVVMNKDTWDSLPVDVQRVFTEVCEEWAEKHARVWTYYDKAGIDYFLTFEGRELIELSPQEMTRWVEATRPLIDEYISEKTAMGLPAADYEAYLVERTSYWAEKTPTEESCINWVEQELL